MYGIELLQYKRDILIFENTSDVEKFGPEWKETFEFQATELNIAFYNLYIAILKTFFIEKVLNWILKKL